jgi:hypothetical protein
MECPFAIGPWSGPKLYATIREHLHAVKHCLNRMCQNRSGWAVLSAVLLKGMYHGFYRASVSLAVFVLKLGAKSAGWTPALRNLCSPIIRCLIP